MLDFGEKRSLDKYENGKPVAQYKWTKIKEPVRDDSEELSKFIQFQRDHKDSKEVSFKRTFSDKGNRFIEKEYRD